MANLREIADAERSRREHAARNGGIVVQSESPMPSDAEIEQEKAERRALSEQIRQQLIMTQSLQPASPARLMRDRLVKRINAFQENLNSSQEVGARLVSFGSITIHIRDVTWWDWDTVIFYGESESGERVELIQHFTQVSVMLIALPAKGKARRIGFSSGEDKH